MMPRSTPRKRTAAMTCDEISPPPRTARSESDSEPRSQADVKTHFIGTPVKNETTRSPADSSYSAMTHSPSTPKHYEGESNVQVLHFGRNVNVSQSAEAIHFKDDNSRWEIG